MRDLKTSQLSLFTSVCWIVGSLFFTAVIGYTVIPFYVEAHHKKQEDPGNHIVKITQTGPVKEALSSLYLMELLSLSVDKPSRLSTFRLEEAERTLYHSPVIAKAKLSLKSPGILYVDYEARTPIAWLYDFVNIGLDAEGVPFPIFPFYSPKKMPEIYLGEKRGLKWNQPINNPKMRLALALLDVLSSVPFFVQRIDVSDAWKSFYGKRQIVLCIEESFKVLYRDREIICIVPRILRLNTKTYPKEIECYKVLRQKWPWKFDPSKVCSINEKNEVRLPEEVIDLRIENMVFFGDQS